MEIAYEIERSLMKVRYAAASEPAKSAQQAAEGRKGLRIGQVSKLSGVGIEALRFYERQGLLDNPSRTNSGYRLYAPSVLERLEFIKRAQALGFSLAEIARIIVEKEAGQNPCSEVREIVRRRLKEIDERLKQMQRYRRELASSLAEWDEAGDVEGHVCGLIEGASIKRAATGPQKLRRKKLKARRQ